MAKNTFKRSIAMLLVLNMLTGMLPIQALAEDGNTEAPVITVTVTPSESSSEKKESAPAEKQESAPAEKQEAAPAEKKESAPAEKSESAPAEKTESAPAEKTESAPAEKTESAPAEKTESAPAEKTESAPAEKTETVEVVSYNESGSESDSEPVEIGKQEVETTHGVTEEVETEIKTETTENENGSTSVKTEEVAVEFVTAGGSLVDFIGVSDMTTEENGLIHGNANEEYLVYKETDNGYYVAEGGSELTLEEVDMGEDVTVDVPLTDEEGKNQNTVVGGPEVGDDMGSKGDKPTSDKDGKYDYTDSKVHQQGSVTITTTEVLFSEKIDVENTDLEHVVSDTTPTDNNDLVYADVAPDMYLPGYEGEILPPEGSLDDDYAYTYVGTGNTSKFVPAIVYTKPLDEAGKLAQYGENAYIKKNSITYYYVGCLPEEVKATIAYDENGGYILDEEGYILNKDGNRIFKEELTSVDPDGNTVYLHRFDKINNNYKVEGWFEDGEWQAELNGDESFSTIWAGPQQFILVDDNGNVVTAYCADASTPTQDNFGYNVENLEDATYYSEEDAKMIRSIAANGYWGTKDGFGSLEEMKKKLAEAGFTAEELASLNDGAALTATQMAIWSCSNKMSSIQFVNAFYSTWGIKNGVNIPETKEDEVKVMFKLYDYLMNLAPTDVEGTTADTIINVDNFVDNMEVTVIEKAKDHENNNDDDHNNDAYVTNLTFALVVTPSTENGDDLVVKVVDAAGNVIASGRVAGEMTEEDKANGMVQLDRDEENNYTFSGITMIEGEQNFNLTLEGIQNLKEGVYLYSSEVDTDGTSSQTLVGVSSGERAVNVSMNIKFELDVKDTVVAHERVWRHETTRENPLPPAEYRLGFGVGQLEVIEEEVPLAAPPQTGDMSILWFAMIVMSGCGLCILNLLEKRKCRA